VGLGKIRGLIASAPVEPLTCLQKEIEVRMAPTRTEVTAVHRIKDRSLFWRLRGIWECLRGDLTWHQVKRTRASTSATP